MTEEEIRSLEIEAAKVMGWQSSEDADDENLWCLIDPKGAWFSGDYHGFETEELAWRARCPEFARDPAAILSALEWLTRNNAEHPDPRYRSGIWGVTNDEYGWAVHNYQAGREQSNKWFQGETLGIAICRAIVALKTEATDATL